MKIETALNGETWIKAIDYPDYEVSTMGRIRSISRVARNGQFFTGKILSPCVKRDGYCGIGLRKNCVRKTVHLHRVIAYNYIPNPDKKVEVNHINGIKKDNRIENLEWVTKSENIRHAHLTGLIKMKAAENNPSAVLNWVQVNEIREKRKLYKIPFRKLGAEYGVTDRAIRKIISNETWKTLS